MTDTPRPVPTAAPGEPGAPTPQAWAAAVNTDRPVIDGIRDITQSPFYDPDIDDENEMEESA